VDRSVAERMRQIDHEIAMKRIREDSAKWQRTLAETRRLEERVRLQLRQFDWQNAKFWRRTDGRPVPMTLLEQQQRHVIETHGIVLPSEEHQVERYRRHIADLARLHGIAISWDAAYINGYAWSRLKKIECAPIVSAWGYATVLHEIGHVAHPCEPSHTKVKAGEKTYCVACEVRAWRAASAWALAWTEEMHCNMREALASYRKFATDAERAVIDAMSSRMGFHSIRQERAKRELERCEEK
jgi:hypothetical protein